MQHERDHLEESGLDLELPLNRRSLTVVVVVLTMLSGGWSMIPVFAPRIMELYDLTNEQYGTMIGLRGIAAIPGYVVVGPLIVAFGTRRVAEASLFGTGLFFLYGESFRRCCRCSVALSVWDFFLVYFRLPYRRY